MNKLTKVILIPLAVIGLSACSDSKRYTDDDGVLHVEKHLFNYECPSATTCKQTANLYVIQKQGQYLEADEDFVEQCLEDKEQGVDVDMICRNMMVPGQTRTMTTSARAMESILNK